MDRPNVSLSKPSPFLLSVLLFCVAGCGNETADRQSDSADDERPFFVVDRLATGPLTLSELQINIPEDLDAMLNGKQRACALSEIEKLALAAGDPETLDPTNIAYLREVDSEDWRDLSSYMKRVILAQAITSRAFALC